MTVYACERCGERVALTVAEWRQLPQGVYGRRVHCRACKTERTWMRQRQPKLKGSGADGRVVCSECGAANPRLHYRTDPRNFREIRFLVCRGCAVKLGLAEVDFIRTETVLRVAA